MRDLSTIFGKKLRALEEVKAFRGFPGSGNIQLIPAGAVTGEVYSYIPKGAGYFQIVPEDKENISLYVADTEAVEVVSSDAKDESSIFGNIFAGAGTLISNGGTWLSKNSGFVATGFKESIDILDTNTEKYIRYALIGGGLVLAIQIIKLFKE